MACAWSAPSHYLKQWWDILNWTIRDKFQWKLNQNSYIFIQENAFDNISSAKWRPFLWVNLLWPSDAKWRHTPWPALVWEMSLTSYHWNNWCLAIGEVLCYSHHSMLNLKAFEIYLVIHLELHCLKANAWIHHTDVIMTTMASRITSLKVVYSIVNSGADQRKHQSSASLAFVRGIHRDRGIPRTNGQ